jgi:hypothetical protein
MQTITYNFICYFIMSFFFHVLSHNLCQPFHGMRPLLFLFRYVFRKNQNGLLQFVVQYSAPSHIHMFGKWSLDQGGCSTKWNNCIPQDIDTSCRYDNAPRWFPQAMDVTESHYIVLIKFIMGCDLYCFYLDMYLGRIKMAFYSLLCNTLPLRIYTYVFNIKCRG